MNKLVLLGVALFVYMSILFCIALVRKNNGIADIGYGLGFSVLVTTALVLAQGVEPYVFLLVGIIYLWSVRLAMRIYRKNRGKPEDFRYKAWRDAWKYFTLRSFFQIYMLQGLIIFLIASPALVLVLFGEGGAPPVLFFVGIVVSIVGLSIESVSDAQLDAFLKDTERKGTIMQSGLWKYSRHPNYFGESLMWIGVGLATLTVQPFPILSVVSPFLITFLLLKVSGIPMLEKRWAGNPEWEVYKAKTSPFIPLPPGK